MKESFLHYIWKFKKFNLYNLKTVCGKKVEIIKTGIHNFNAGSDFLEAKIIIDGIEWSGNIEIHNKSSDFTKHKHHLDNASHTIILHVVFEHDKEISFLSENNIYTLELKPQIPDTVINNYQLLENKNFSFIPCEKLIVEYKKTPLLTENLFLEKLEDKTKRINELLVLYKNDWERTFASTLAYTFGLKINAFAFEQIFQQIDYKIIKKISSKQLLLEALFFGITHNFDNNYIDEYSSSLSKEFSFLTSKFSLPKAYINIKYSKLRPANFPTIRLSQLANLISQYQNLFSFVIGAKNIDQYLKLLDNVCASEYWNNHYTFGKPSKQNFLKILSQAQKELIIINAFLPIKFAYSLHIGKPMNDEILSIISNLSTEKNSIIYKFKKLGIPFHSALDSQAFLNLYKNKCSTQQCLNCEIGYHLLKG